MATVGTRTKSLKERLCSSEERLYGLLLGSFSPTMAEIAGRAGYDFVVIDMEQVDGDIADALECMRGLSIPAIMRLPENSTTWAKKALDIGSQGLMFPNVNDAQSARNAVLYSRYPLNGVRGVAHPAVRASNYGFDQHYLARFDKDLFIICQVESVEKVKDIAAVDGVDCIIFNVPLDLTNLRMAEKSVLENANGHGPYLAAFAMPHDHDSALELRRRGYHMVCGGVDLTLFRDATFHRQNSATSFGRYNRFSH